MRKQKEKYRIHIHDKRAIIKTHINNNPLFEDSPFGYTSRVGLKFFRGANFSSQQLALNEARAEIRRYLNAKSRK